MTIGKITVLRSLSHTVDYVATDRIGTAIRLNRVSEFIKNNVWYYILYVPYPTTMTGTYVLVLIYLSV